jgi:hypothetical protein
MACDGMTLMLEKIFRCKKLDLDKHLFQIPGHIFIKIELAE